MSSSAILSPKQGADEQISTTVAEIAARIGVLRELVASDPDQVVRLLDAAVPPIDVLVRPLPRVPSMLALLDELETLVGLLSERRDETSRELRAHRSRRDASLAYRSNPVR